MTPETAHPHLAWVEEVGIRVEEVGLITRLIRINMFVEQLLSRIIEPFGVSVGDSIVLANLRRGVTLPVALCRILNRTTGGMSLTLDRLVEAGWVDRVPDPNDRRRVIVKLTADGLEKSRAINEALHRWEDSRSLAPDEAKTIGAVLDEVAMLVSDGVSPG